MICNPKQQAQWKFASHKKIFKSTYFSPQNFGNPTTSMQYMTSKNAICCSCVAQRCHCAVVVVSRDIT